MTFPELLLQRAIGDMWNHISASNNLPMMSAAIKQNVLFVFFFFLVGEGEIGRIIS